MRPLELHQLVMTPDGPGRVRNLVRGGGVVTAVLVELDANHERQPMWRSYAPDDVRPVT